MAVNRYLMKMNHMEAVFRITNTTSGPASSTIVLATDLLKSNETLSGEALVVAISCMEMSVEVTGEINIVRNTKVLYNFFENTDEFEMALTSDKEEGASDIVINFTKKGTFIIRLLKEQGYKPKFRPEQGIYA